MYKFTIFFLLVSIILSHSMSNQDYEYDDDIMEVLESSHANTSLVKPFYHHIYCPSFKSDISEAFPYKTIREIQWHRKTFWISSL
jgi:hypothetical protein